MTIELKGITWNHTRGYVSMIATSQRFMELNPHVKISWEKRSLQEFADFPIQSLIASYDLLVIDHPWAGFAANKRALVNFSEHLSEAYLKDQESNTVGHSHRSYNFAGYQSALAIDAATPVASWRADLFEQLGQQPPTDWKQLLELARIGKVIMPGIPIDSLMNFYMLCATLGEAPFQSEERVVSRETAVQALEMYRELTSYCTEQIFTWNPIAVYEQLASKDEYLYCPFAYGYSNYSRPGYAAHLVTFGDLVALGDRGPLQSTLGGTGLAVSASSKHMQTAVEYAAFTASPIIQQTLFTESGGQPGHRSAWLSEETNRRSAHYFKQTLPALDRAYLRPRYEGYLHFQDHAGDSVQHYLQGKASINNVLQRMESLYAESLTQGRAPR